MASLADLKQADWIKACKKLGLEISLKSGKGSHALIKHPKNNTKYTIQTDLYKILNQKYYKLLRGWGFTDEQLCDALGLSIASVSQFASADQ